MGVLTNLKNQIGEIALQQPEVNAYGEGSVYELLNSGGKIEKYAAVVATFQSASIDDDNYTATINLFYIDRLTKFDDNNRLQIQDTAVQTLHNIFLQLVDEYDYLVENENYTLFTQKFADNCAGAYCTLKITLPISGCFEQY